MRLASFSIGGVAKTLCRINLCHAVKERRMPDGRKSLRNERIRFPAREECGRYGNFCPAIRAGIVIPVTCVHQAERLFSPVSICERIKRGERKRVFFAGKTQFWVSLSDMEGGMLLGWKGEIHTEKN